MFNDTILASQALVSVSTPLFIIGNGDDLATRSNAMEVRKDGKVGIGKTATNDRLLVNSASGENPFRVQINGSTKMRIFSNGSISLGTNNSSISSGDVYVHNDLGIGVDNPSEKLEVNGNFLMTHPGTNTTDGFKMLNSDPNKNWWRMYTYNGNGHLHLYSKQGGNATSVGNFNDASGVYSATSDYRLKNDFKDLRFNWSNFMNLKPLSYKYKSQTDEKRSIGFIAQEVEKIYPELVNYTKEEDVYHMNYSGFGVVAVKAVQELKTEVEILTEENKILKESQELQNKKIEELYQMILEMKKVIVE